MNKTIINSLSVIGFVLIFLSVSHAQKLEIKPFTLETVGGAVALELKKNGDIYVQSSKAGKLSADGQVFNIKNVLVAHLGSDGILKGADQKPLVKILPNGSWDNGNGAILAWSKDGKFSVDAVLVLQIKPNKPKYYRTASLLIAVFSNGSNVKITADRPS